jgi:hypothetical protein
LGLNLRYLEPKVREIQPKSGEFKPKLRDKGPKFMDIRPNFRFYPFGLNPLIIGCKFEI